MSTFISYNCAFVHTDALTTIVLGGGGEWQRCD